jgi:hypothetical protein
MLTVVRRSFLRPARHIPNMPLRIHDPPHPISPELICDRSQNPRPSSNCSRNHAVDVFEIEIDHHRRAAIVQRSTARQMRSLSMHHDQQFANPERRMSNAPILIPASRKFPRPKRHPAELNLRRGIHAHQHWNDGSNKVGHQRVTHRTPRNRVSGRLNGPDFIVRGIPRKTNKPAAIERGKSGFGAYAARVSQLFMVFASTSPAC